MFFSPYLWLLLSLLFQVFHFPNLYNFKAAVLNLWVLIPLESDDPFIGVTEDHQKTQTLQFLTVAKLVLWWRGGSPQHEERY